jgi:hypothetical protein
MKSQHSTNFGAHVRFLAYYAEYYDYNIIAYAEI